MRIATGEGVFETFNRGTADAIDRTRFEVLCAGEYLGRLNRSIREADRKPGSWPGYATNANPTQAVVDAVVSRVVKGRAK